MKADFEYLWPKKTGIRACATDGFNFLTLGLFASEPSGLDKNTWPFANATDLESANKSPPYLHNCE